MALPAINSFIDEQLRPVTFEEYRALPEDGPRYELINGVLSMSPAPKPIHQFVLGRLFSAMDEYVRQRRLGFVAFAPFDVWLSGYTAVQPDLLFYRASNTGALGDDFAKKAPDLAVEVLSPSNRRMDLIVKRALYAASGVSEYWIVDPEKRTISINVLDGAHYADATFVQGPIVSPTLAGIAIDFESTFVMPAWTFGLMGEPEDESDDE